MEAPTDLILVGHVAGAYGIQGWVRVRTYSADADALLHARTWWLDKPQPADAEVLKSRRQGEDVVAQLMGVADRDTAEALKGAQVHIRRSHFPALSDDEYYWVELIGLAVENLRGDALGKVSDLMDNGAHPILRVAPVEADAGERLIPFVDAFVRTVDLAAGKIVVDWEADY
ncbi:MAG: ribosome maturation factor RimM [Burkholderiaceae bacterium]